jgi:hypothetical protein
MEQPVSERQRQREIAEARRVRHVHELRVAQKRREVTRVKATRASSRDPGATLIASGRLIAKAGSFRLIYTSLLAALLVGVPLSFLRPPLFFVSVPVFLLVWLGNVANPAMVLKCPDCRRRVKMGAVACGHCGCRFPSR